MNEIAKLTKKEQEAVDLTGPRPAGKKQLEALVPKEIVEGLDLGDLEFRPLGWFQHNPENDVFRGLKTAGYFQALEKDIREAGAIVSPLIAMPNGLLLEGESRLEIAKKLHSEGVTGFNRLPVRLVLSVLSEDEQRKRLYLGNLSRFEIDEDTRLSLYARVWPGYFLTEKKAGRPAGNGDTMTPFSETAAEVALATGKSLRQVKRDKATIRVATKSAQDRGKQTPDPDDIRAARLKAKEDKKSPSTGEHIETTATETKQDVVGEIRRIIGILNALSTNDPDQSRVIAYRSAAAILQKALK